MSGFRKEGKHVFLENVCIFWTDADGRDWITPRGARYFAEADKDQATAEAIQRGRSHSSSKERRPRRNDWRYYKARAQNKKVES